MRGNRDGTFHEPPRAPVGSCARRVLSADFNRDGLADLALERCDNVGGSETGVVAILLGTGNARFTPPVDYDPGVARIAGDWNGDDIVDLAGPFLVGGGIATLLGNGDGTFRPGADSPVAALTRVEHVVPGDFNNDARTDMLLAGSQNIGDATRFGLAVALGDGDGGFASDLFIPTPADDGARALGVGDFDRDGNLDAAFSERRPDEDAWDVWVFFGNGAGALLPGGSYPVGDYPEGLAVGDLNGDGSPDVVTSNRYGHTVSVLIGNGDGTFRPTTTYYGGGSEPMAVILADFTGDAATDVAIANVSSNNVSILPGTGDGTLTVLGVGFATDELPIHFAAGDFNHDGLLDLITVNHTTGTISGLLNRTPPPAADKP